MQKIWNRPVAAVWSLVTQDQHNQVNMNICTYVTSISMQPKQMLVAVYKNTKTHENISSGHAKVVLLQLLSQPLAPAVRICGQYSGFSIDKVARLRKRFTLMSHQDLLYFSNSCGYMILQVEALLPASGDHDLLVGTVISHKNVSNETILTTTYLKEKKIIR